MEQAEEAVVSETEAETPPVEEKDTCYRISVYPCGHVSLPFGDLYQVQNKIQIDQQNTDGTDKTPLFTYRTEDEIRILLRHELQLRLRAVQVALSEEPSYPTTPL